MVWLSLHTDSMAEAERKAQAAWDAMLRSWEANLKGDTSEAAKRYEAALDIARAYGFTFLPAQKVAALPLDDIIARVDAARDGKGRVSLPAARALLGNVVKPEITITGALDAYWGIAADKILGKSPDQVRRWENPRKKAIAAFVEVIGDLPLSEITPDHMQDFRDHLIERIRAGEIKPNSANKDIIHLTSTLKAVDKAKRLRLDMPLTGWAIAEGEKRTRTGFSTAWIRDRLLAPGALSGLNGEARGVIRAMVNTGARPSELTFLTGAQIRLDVDIPHISIEPVGRTLKSQYARRVIPLLGVSLDAFRANPDGFPRYRDSASLSALVNKYFETHSLKETPDTTLYSLRHSFQDRMIEARIDDRIRRTLFGHTLTEEKYGEGGSLALWRDLLKPVAL